MKRSSYERASKLFHVLSHQARLCIMDELRRGEACVCHLQAVLRRHQAYVSQQLRVLREANLVEDRKDGLLVFYRLVDAQAMLLLNETLGPAGQRESIVGCPCPHCQE
jgi:ArsR family transcriptional regulator